MLVGTKTAAASGFGLLLVVALAQGACFGGATVGQECGSTGDCASGLQCLAGICAPRCESHAECGDGFVCASGECEEVISSIGDPCARELDCGPGQTCQIDEDGASGNQSLLATCQAEQIGAVVGAVCGGDVDCRSGACNLGRCTQLCVDGPDCPEGLACTEIPRVRDNAAIGMFRGCLQSTGVLEHSIELTEAPATVALPVPGNARSVAITAVANDPNVLVGPFNLRAPSGAVLYDEPQTLDDFLANPVRFTLGFGESTFLFPNTPDLDLEAGAYQLEIGTALLPGLKISDVPEVTVHYKLGTSAILDVHVYILDLANHPCQGGIGAADLDASTARVLTVFQSYIQNIDQILGQANIRLGEVTYHDVGDQTLLDALEEGDIAQLASLSTTDTGVNLFLVRSIDPGGVQVLSAGTPGAPRSSGSRTAGIAVSMDTLCYRSWTELSRITSHAIARQMGLFRNVEPESGIEDPIGDSLPDDANLMFYSEFGGIELSDGQAQVLRLYPGLR